MALATPKRVYVPGFGGLIQADPPWLAYKGKGDDASLSEWAKRVAASWLQEFNETLTNGAVAYLADSSSNKVLRKHADRVRELLALSTKGPRSVNDHHACPMCKHDWDLHFDEGGKPCRCASCKCAEATRK